MRIISIGIDGAGNTSEEAVEGINNSLVVFDNEVEGHRIRVIAQGTDAGGGGVGSSLFEGLCLKDQIYNVLQYKIVTCLALAISNHFGTSVVLQLVTVQVINWQRR